MPVLNIWQGRYTLNSVNSVFVFVEFVFHLSDELTVELLGNKLV